MLSYLNKERLEDIKKAPQANATKHGVPCADFRASPTSKIDAYKKKMAELKAKATRVAGKVGGIATQASSIQEFMEGIVDLDIAEVCASPYLGLVVVLEG